MPDFLNSDYSWASEVGGFIKLSIDSSDTGLHNGRPTVNLRWIEGAGRWVGFKIALNADSLPDNIYFYFKNCTKNTPLTIKFIDKDNTYSRYRIDTPKMKWILIRLDLTKLPGITFKKDLRELLVIYEGNSESGSFSLDGLALIK